MQKNVKNVIQRILIKRRKKKGLRIRKKIRRIIQIS